MNPEPNPDPLAHLVFDDMPDPAPKSKPQPETEPEDPLGWDAFIGWLNKTPGYPERFEVWQAAVKRAGDLIRGYQSEIVRITQENAQHCETIQFYLARYRQQQARIKELEAEVERLSKGKDEPR
jgi:hypothetical protein